MKHYSSEEKAMWLEDWQESGKSAWTYAKENGIFPQTFINWTKPRKESRESLVEVPRNIFRSVCQAPEILIEKGELKIHIPLEPVLSELQNVMAGVRQII
jgi:hypothetical protein